MNKDESDYSSATATERRQGMAIDSVKDDIRDIKETLKSLASSMIKLALVEERQAQTANAQERLFTQISELAVRVAQVEITAANSARTGRWVDSAVIAVVVLAAMFVARKVGLSV
jgi:response regulator RpfG family c-di-GMP phosphodiesterase